MTMEVETVVAVSLMMAVFSAVAAVGTSIVLGAGFERLRAGFDIVRKQTGFFSDAIHKLERKVEIVDKQTNDFSHSISSLEAKVVTVSQQAGAFGGSVKQLEDKVDIVNKQAGFFGDAIYRLEKKIDVLDAHEQVITEKMQRMAVTADHLISADAHARASESLLLGAGPLMAATGDNAPQTDAVCQELKFNIPPSLSYAWTDSDPKQVRYH